MIIKALCSSVMHQIHDVNGCKHHKGGDQEQRKELFDFTHVAPTIKEQDAFLCAPKVLLLVKTQEYLGGGVSLPAIVLLVVIFVVCILIYLIN